MIEKFSRWTLIKQDAINQFFSFYQRRNNTSYDKYKQWKRFAKILRGFDMNPMKRECNENETKTNMQSAAVFFV